MSLTIFLNGSIYVDQSEGYVVARAAEQPITLARQISALEVTLGVILFERSVRGLTLTQVGRDLLDHVRAMGDAAALISIVAEGQSQDVTGEVRVRATDLMSAAILPRLLDPLRQTAPGLRIGINATNDSQSLTRREADIAIRHVRPEQPDLIARHVADFRANLYAATAYLDRAGRPRTPRDVADHAFVGSPDPSRLIALLQDRGMPVRAESFTISSDSNVVVWELVRSGYGISMLPEVPCAAEPGIEKVLPSLAPLQFPVWLVTHRELRTSRRIRVVFDHLARALSAISSSSSAPMDQRPITH